MDLGKNALVSRKNCLSSGNFACNISLYLLFSLESKGFITKMIYGNEKVESFRFIFLPQRYFVNSFLKFW